MIIPKSANDVRCQTCLLGSVESFDKILAFRKPEGKTDGILKLVLSLLEDATNLQMQNEEQQDTLTFLKKQVFLLLSKSPCYSSELLLFSSLLFTISPRAFRHLRNYGNLALPHESTIDNSKDSIIVDKSTDISVTKYFSVAIVYHSKAKTATVTTFLVLCVLETCNAQGIVEGIKCVLSEYRLNLEKLVGISTDNAKVVVEVNKE